MFGKVFLAILSTILAISCATSGEKNEEKNETMNMDKVKLIPRKTLFGNPDKARLKISPDGEKLAYIAPSEKGVLNVWIKTIGKDDDTMFTNDEYRGVRYYGWAYNNRQIIYIQDKGGDENWHLYSVDLDSKETKDLTPFVGVRAQNIISDRNFPDEILIGLNKRDKKVFDMYRLNLKSGELKMEAENPGNVGGWATDQNFVIRVAHASNPTDGSTMIKVRNSVHDEWRVLITVPFGEHAGVFGFTPDGKNLYVETSIGSDTSRLIEVNFETGEEIREIAKNDKSDIGKIIKNEKTHELQAVSFNYEKTTWSFFDKNVENDFSTIKRSTKGNIHLTSRDLEDKKWIIASEPDDTPMSYYFYDRETKKLLFLFTQRPELEKYRLAKIKPVTIKARDGLELVSYLTLPLDIKPEKLPLVLFVHGGPWARDSWGFRTFNQWLANRGYAVLQVNFRASSGFGKKFLNAGNGEWGTGSMQHDLSDAVKWAIDSGIADPSKVAIMGGSYGGYATLAGLTFTPELYACGVDIVGPSNLKTLLETIPPYWKNFKTQMVLRIGDVENDEELNKKISPLFHVDKIKVPLLIGQGANDPRVKISESDQIVEAMRKKNIPVDYIVFPDEGHGFRRPENSLEFQGITEEFLSKCLGGRVEPYEKVEGSTAERR